MGNQITPLGCEFLGKTLSTSHCGIKTLIIDNNFIGDSGLQNLTLGLRSNSVIKNLSLKYCGIGKDSMIYFQEILANIHTKIKNLDLQGNHFGNEGFFQLLRVLQLNEVL
jgi:Ran GTPase-activating protein (RanGAP) involved in mRNA processing and transport